jgi:hypothetical protein
MDLIFYAIITGFALSLLADSLQKLGTQMEQAVRDYYGR